MTILFCVKYLNIKLRSSILIIKSDTQKQVIEYGSECRFHDLNYVEVGFFKIFFKYIFIYPLNSLCT